MDGTLVVSSLSRLGHGAQGNSTVLYGAGAQPEADLLRQSLRRIAGAEIA